MSSFDSQNYYGEIVNPMVFNASSDLIISTSQNNENVAIPTNYSRNSESWLFHDFSR